MKSEIVRVTDQDDIARNILIERIGSDDVTIGEIYHIKRLLGLTDKELCDLLEA